MEYRPYYYQDFAEKFILDNPEAGSYWIWVWEKR